MYSLGEFFYCEELESEVEVLFTLTYENEEYVIAENEEGDKFVFISDEDDEGVNLVEEEDLVDEVLEYMEEEYMAKADIGDWEDDGYYDREDHVNINDNFEDYDEEY